MPVPPSMETIKTTDTLTDLTRKGTCIEFFSAYQELDTERMINLATPEATVWFQPLGEDGKGKFQEFGKAVWGLLMDCFPDLDNTVDSMYSEDEAIGRIFANYSLFESIFNCLHTSSE